MFVRKKTKLRIAYTALAFTALAVVASDAHLRNNASLSGSNAERSESQTPEIPLALTPLAESPFPAARPNREQPGTTALAVSKREKAAPLRGVFFLTVAVKVESKGGPVALVRGTRVRLLRQQEGWLLVRHNGTDFLIEKSQVTNDLNALTLARHSS